MIDGLFLILNLRSRKLRWNRSNINIESVRERYDIIHDKYNKSNTVTLRTHLPSMFSLLSDT